MEAALLRRDWPIFGWRTPEEEERYQEQELTKERLIANGETLFDTLLHCGHRYPIDVLPEPEIGSFLAFQLADGNYREWQWIESTQDEVEVTRGFAMKRTAVYLALEGK